VDREIIEAAQRWLRDPDLHQTFWMAALEAQAEGRSDYLEAGHEAARSERNRTVMEQHHHISTTPRVSMQTDGDGGEFEANVLADHHEPYTEDPEAPDSAEQWGTLERLRDQLSPLDREMLDRVSAGETNGKSQPRSG
jgi:hypothetical protein